MNKLLSCHYNMDTNRVEARFADGTTLAISRKSLPSIAAFLWKMGAKMRA